MSTWNLTLALKSTILFLTGGWLAGHYTDEQSVHKPVPGPNSFPQGHPSQGLSQDLTQPTCI